MNPSTRRTFLGRAIAGAGALAALPLLDSLACRADEEEKGLKMAYGLVTYQWGNDWDLPTLIANCTKADVQGVELRTTHAHGVEPSLNEAQRDEVRARFADSAVTLVGLGSDERFDNPDPAILKKSIHTAKGFILLSHDVGGTGVKVKPDSFHDGVPHEKTILQIGRALNELGEFGAGYGQQVRLEVHGQCAELPTIKAIMDVADNENVAICWNSNPQDLQGEGLEHNFNLVKNRLGATLHVRELDSDGYPWQKLIDLLVGCDYEGWVMIEASTRPDDRVAALAEQAKLFAEMLVDARKRLG